MLTKSDLSGIKKIVDTSIVRETSAIKEDIGYLKQDVSMLKEDMGSIKQDVKSLKKDMRYVKKTVKVMVPFFNNEDIQLQKRVRRIEDHLALST